MSFKSREKKRQAKIAINKARNDNLEKVAGRHYLTIVSRHSSCNSCGTPLREGKVCVYRRTPREILCEPCARDRELRPRPSRRWEKFAQQQRKA